MNQKPQLGKNLTGSRSHDERTRAMVTGMDEFPPTSGGTSEGPGKIRIGYAKKAQPIGSVPPPPDIKGKAKAAVTALKGESPTMLVDKLGERLGFERMGTRLYSAMLSKHEAFGGFGGGPTRQELEEILRQEHEHFMLLVEAVERLGADPTAITPSAELQSTAAEGIMKVIVDPRTTLLQSLEAILVAELNDYEGWDALIALLRQAGQTQIADQFTAALQQESEHVAKVRNWVKRGHGLDAKAAE